MGSRARRASQIRPRCSWERPARSGAHFSPVRTTPRAGPLTDRRRHTSTHHYLRSPQRRAPPAGTVGQRRRYARVTSVRPTGYDAVTSPAVFVSTHPCCPSLGRGKRLGCKGDEGACGALAGAMVSAASRGTVRQERPWRTRWLRRSSTRNSMPGGQSSSITCRSLGVRTGNLLRRRGRTPDAGVLAAPAADLVRRRAPGPGLVGPVRDGGRGQRPLTGLLLG